MNPSVTHELTNTPTTVTLPRIHVLGLIKKIKTTTSIVLITGVSVWQAFHATIKPSIVCAGAKDDIEHDVCLGIEVCPHGAVQYASKRSDNSSFFDTRNVYNNYTQNLNNNKEIVKSSLLINKSAFIKNSAADGCIHV